MPAAPEDDLELSCEKFNLAKSSLTKSDSLRVRNLEMPESDYQMNDQNLLRPHRTHLYDLKHVSDVYLRAHLTHHSNLQHSNPLNFGSILPNQSSSILYIIAQS